MMNLRIPILLVLICSLQLLSCQNRADDPSAGASDTPEDTVTANPPVKVKSLERGNSSNGQLIYVPVYSHIYQLDRQKTFNLTATLSIRNSDPNRLLTVLTVSYYDSEGLLVQHYLEQPRTIKPLASTSFVVEERDLRGGIGANFLVSWKAPEPVTPPVVEAVMISTSQQQGISFLSEGRVLQEYETDQNDTN